MITMNNINTLKTEIETACKIASWNPSQQQLARIANEIASTRPTSTSQVEGIVSTVCPDTTFFSLEGIDNSDLRALLALAIQASSMKS